MATKGRLPPAARPPAKVTACPSDMPTSKVRFGKVFSILPIEVPDTMAAVMPMTRSSRCASSTMVSPNTSCQSGGCSPVFLIFSPVSGTNLPGACHCAGFLSASGNPFPLTVHRCSRRGPCMSFISRRIFTILMTSWPSNGPKYLMLRPSNMFCFPETSALMELLKRISSPLRWSLRMPLRRK